MTRHSCLLYISGFGPNSHEYESYQRWGPTLGIRLYLRHNYSGLAITRTGDNSRIPFNSNHLIEDFSFENSEAEVLIAQSSNQQCTRERSLDQDDREFE